MFVGDSIVRKIDRAQSKRTTWWFAFQEKNRSYHREGGSMQENNTEKVGATAIFRKYMQLVRRDKQTRVEQIIMAGF